MKHGVQTWQVCGRMSRWVRVLVLLAGCAQFAGGQNTFQKHAQPNIHHLKVAGRATDGREFILTVETDYPAGGPAAQLMAVIKSKDQKEATSWFESERSTLAPGKGKHSLRVTLRDDHPITSKPLVTDRVEIWAKDTANQSIIGVAAFPLKLSWQTINSSDQVRNQPEVVVKKTTRSAPVAKKEPAPEPPAATAVEPAPAADAPDEKKEAA